jgi:hypothetical protein
VRARPDRGFEHHAGVGRFRFKIATEGSPKMPDRPEELERRLRALAEASAQGADFDPLSWFWLLLLGLVGPIVLIVLGWYA